MLFRIDQLKIENEKKELKIKLINCYKKYYDDIKEEQKFEQENYKNVGLEKLYSNYLLLIKEYEDKEYEDKEYEDEFYIILKDKLKEYNRSHYRHIKYSKKIIYDLLNIKKNILREAEEKRNEGRKKNL